MIVSRSVRLLPLVLGSMVPLGGCYTGLDLTGDGSVADEGGDEDDGGEDQSCGEMAVAATPLRRMTDVQYRNTVRDLFGGVVTASEVFPKTEHNLGFTNNPDANTVSLMNAEDILVAAEDAAVQVVDNLAAVLPCSPGPDACAEQFIDEFGPRAFRRPLAAEERTLLVDLYYSARDEADFADAIGNVVTAVLQSPQFLYFIEDGAAEEGADPGLVKLDDYAVASRLSYLLWDTMPDAELFAAAEAGELGSPDGVEQHARRLLADAERAGPAVIRFYREWMDLDGLRAFDKDAAQYPEFDATLAAAMDEEFGRFVQGVVWGDQPTLEALFTSSRTEVDAVMAAFFGVDGPTAEGSWQSVELPGERRAGILTRPALMAEHANAAESSPIFRGHLVRTRVMCEAIPAPPPDAMAMAPEFPADATQRERSEILMNQDLCGGCHRIMNPTGLGFEHYDPIGAWRDDDVDGEPIDASGEILGSSEALNGPFEGVTELAAKLAGSEQVRDCVAQQFYQHTFGVTPREAPSCAVAPVQQALADSEGDLMEMMVSFTTSDAFRYRMIEENS